MYEFRCLPQPELDLDALQGDRLELVNLHAVLAEAQTRANALEEIMDFGREAAEKQTQTLVNRGAALLARAAADGSEQTVWQEHLDAGRAILPTPLLTQCCPSSQGGSGCSFPLRIPAAVPWKHYPQSHDEAAGTWRLKHGDYRIYVGSSLQDIQLTQDITI